MLHWKISSQVPPFILVPINDAFAIGTKLKYLNVYADWSFPLTRVLWRVQMQGVNPQVHMDHQGLREKIHQM